jgi:hypothetical protein
LEIGLFPVRLDAMVEWCYLDSMQVFLLGLGQSPNHHFSMLLQRARRKTMTNLNAYYHLLQSETRQQLDYFINQQHVHHHEETSIKR